MKKDFTAHNYLSHIVEGGLYIGGLSFVNPNTILPGMISSLHGSSFLLSLAPSLSVIGFMLPPILMAHHISKQKKMMPMIRVSGVFQRLPYLLAAILLYIFLASTNAVLAIVILTPFISGMVGGITLTGWQTLVQETVPPNKRASCFAWRMTVSGLTGVLGGLLSGWLIGHYPGVIGYAILHFCCFVFMALSYWVFTGIKEPDNYVPEQVSEDPSPLATLREIPELLRKWPNFSRYMSSLNFSYGFLFITPFIAVYAKNFLQASDTIYANFTVFQMAGSLAGNFFSAYIGDKFGHKNLLVISRMLMMLLFAAFIFASNTTHFMILFAIFGFAQNTMAIGQSAMTISICPAGKRTLSLATITFVSMFYLLIFSYLGSLVWKYFNYGIFYPAIISIAIMAISLYQIMRVREKWTGESN
ncbi:MAG: MFS transporter [bacterium]